jgi:hypothetical protein
MNFWVGIVTEEVFELKLKLKSLDEKRKQVLNKIIDTKGLLSLITF